MLNASEVVDYYRLKHQYTHISVETFRCIYDSILWWLKAYAKTSSLYDNAVVKCFASKKNTRRLDKMMLFVSSSLLKQSILLRYIDDYV